MLLNTGLVSVTYRQLSPERILALAGEAGLSCVEWGSDVHVPECDVARAAEIGRVTRAAGMHVSSYGTYYRLGQGQSFDAYLNAAEALGAPILRLWAGTTGSAVTPAETRRRWVGEARRCAEAAAARGMRVCFEYHPGTLTDDADSARAFVREIDHPAARLYWQPDFSKPEEEILEGLDKVLPYVDTLHVFTWRPDHTRRPLAEGATFWGKVLKRCADVPELRLLLEFVPGDDPDLLSREARVLYCMEKEAGLL